MNVRHPLYRIPAATALLIALTACTQDELADDNRLSEGEYPVVIRATGLSVEATPQAAPSTRATVDGDWQGVQTVALKMGDAVKEYNVTATDADGYRSATLSRETDPHYWTSRDDITVSAWWPFDNDDITQVPAVKVAADQSTQNAFAASDFIAAIDQTVEFNNPTLEFAHCTARVVVELKPGTGISNVDGAMVSLVSLSSDNGNPAVIRTYNAGGDNYEALVAPQTVTAGNPFIQVELNGGSFCFRPDNKVVLESGKRYTYTVSVNATGLMLTGSTIGDWTDGGGESGAAEDFNYSYDNDTRTYTVYTSYGLQIWANAVQNDLTINCTLAADIDMAGKDWIPIGNKDNRYIGTFDGGNHTITGLNVNTAGENYLGMFGCIGSGGMVKNLMLEKVSLSGNINTIGGLVGLNYGTVTACIFSGDVSAVSGPAGCLVGENNGTVIGCTVEGSVFSYGDAGGVVGRNNGSVTACTFTGDVTGGGQDYFGGVVAYNMESGTVSVCTAIGNVNSNDGDCVGGVVGFNRGTVTSCCHTGGSVSGDKKVGGVAGVNYGTLTDCSHTGGTVSGYSGIIGGVVGDNYELHAGLGILTACTATGDVIGTYYYASQIGGVVGNDGGTVTACWHAKGTVSGTYNVGGVIGSSYDSIVTACYWDDSLDTGIGEGSGESTKIDGTNVTWQTAIDTMNTALESTGTGWLYELIGSLPTLKKQ